MKKFIFLLTLSACFAFPSLTLADDDLDRMMEQWDREKTVRDMRNAINNRDMEEIQRQQERMERQTSDEEFRRLMNN